MAAQLAAKAEQLGAKAEQLRAVAGENAAAGEHEPELTAVGLASDLHALAAAALQASVDRARDAGRTWLEIGDVLGVTRQAAFLRFGRPIDPRTGEAMSNAVLPDAGPRATALLIDWIEGRYDQVVARFDARMAGALPPDALAAAWARVVGTAGEYERMGEPLVRQVGDHTVADIPLSFEAAEMKGRVSYDQAGQVSGLFVVKPETPCPARAMDRRAGPWLSLRGPASALSSGRQVLPRAMAIRRSRTAPLLTRRPSCSYSLVTQGVSPGMA